MANFNTGDTFMTKGISEAISNSVDFGFEVNKSFDRFLECDWSDMEYEEDKLSNDEAIKNGDDRIFGVYHTSKGDIWIITEWDRSYTTILFPEDY